ncbi:MAG: hypothetical protein PHQ81_02725 [Methanofollis sp.]|nr:hypothetical protein [Methanofollis sp.]
MKMKFIGIGIGVLVLVGFICTIGTSMLLDEEMESLSDIAPENHSDPLSSVKSTNNANLTYVVSAPIPSTPEQVTLYKVVKPTVTSELVSSIAGAMDLKGKVRVAYDEMFLSDGPYSLEVNTRSGRIALIDIPRWAIPNDKDLPENLPSDEEAVEIATKYLKEKDLMPHDAVLLDVQHPQAITTKEGKVIDIGYEAIQVSYGRTIGGLPVIGSELMVEIGGGGDILNVYKLWRDYTPGEECSIITPEAALEEMKSVGIFADTKSRQTVEITEIELGYYEAQAMEDPAYFVPIYIFKGSIMDEKTKTPFVNFVPASPEFEEDIPRVK